MSSIKASLLFVKSNVAATRADSQEALSTLTGMKDIQGEPGVDVQTCVKKTLSGNENMHINIVFWINKIKSIVHKKVFSPE